MSGRRSTWVYRCVGVAHKRDAVRSGSRGSRSSDCRLTDEPGWPVLRRSATSGGERVVTAAQEQALLGGVVHPIGGQASGSVPVRSGRGSGRG